MINRKSLIVLVFMLISACQPGQDNVENASQALTLFFRELSGGNYAEATSLYGGSYEVLADLNPDLDEDDHAALWNNGCQINGFQCLTIRTITFNEQSESGEYMYTVEFTDHTGELFVLEACCGDNPTEPPQFQFEYRVVQNQEGKMQVLDLPVYMP